MNTLTRALRATFRPEVQRKPDIHRAARELAKRLAAEHGVEIERLREGGMNIWPPKGWAGDDPHDGDHYAADWGDALPKVQAYASVATAKAAGQKGGAA